MNLRQFVPALVIESNDSAEPTYIQIESLELISHEKDGPSSKSYGDPGLRSYSEKALDFEIEQEVEMVPQSERASTSVNPRNVPRRSTWQKVLDTRPTVPVRVRFEVREIANSVDEELLAIAPSARPALNDLVVRLRVRS